MKNERTPPPPPAHGWRPPPPPPPTDGWWRRKPTGRKAAWIGGVVVVALAAIGAVGSEPEAEVEAIDAPTTVATPDATELVETTSTSTSAPLEPATTPPPTQPPPTTIPATTAPASTAPATTSPTTAARTTTPPTTPAAAASIAIARIVDGDTVELATGQSVRLLGYDTPERGECGYDEAADALAAILSSGTVTLTTDTGDDVDRYGRLLRHVLVDGVPVGLKMIEQGKADARYDSLDGYPRHRYQDEYRAADGHNTFACTTTDATAARGSDAALSSEPWNLPGPDLDCADIGRRVQVLPPDHHRLDRDGDGWGCESYG